MLITTYIALLRAVNVGGTGKLPMTVLKKLCESCGFTSVRTYIASGNVLFQSSLPEREVKALLEKSLQEYAGKPVGVIIRTAAEMADVLTSNPFPDMPGNRTVAIFLDQPPAADALNNLSGGIDEQVRLGVREIYAYYPGGMGNSKLKIPAGRAGTGRNMNTVAKLVDLSRGL